jgi:lipoate-protein ligase A
MEQWFLFDDNPASGAENMARDEFLLERVDREEHTPILRLYSFQPPAITIGYHQDPLEILDIDALRRDRIELVRRITGGRALLHDKELTYCVAAQVDSWSCGAGLRDTFLRISEALTIALRFLGVNARISNGCTGRGRPGLTPPCLASVSMYEITVRGKKIVGSAQRRTRSVFLQHGSILLGPGSSRIARYLGGTWDSMGDRITSIAEELDREVDAQEVRSSLVEAFSVRFGITLQPTRFSVREEKEIEWRSIEKRRELSHIKGMEVAGS